MRAEERWPRDEKESRCAAAARPAFTNPAASEGRPQPMTSGEGGGEGCRAAFRFQVGGNNGGKKGELHDGCWRGETCDAGMRSENPKD